METVTVHIGRLRKRFERWDAFEIISVHGLGYKAVQGKSKVSSRGNNPLNNLQVNKMKNRKNSSGVL